MRIETKEKYFGITELKISNGTETYKIVAEGHPYPHLTVYELLKCDYCGKQIWIEWPIEANEAIICPECVNMHYKGRARVGSPEEPVYG